MSDLWDPIRLTLLLALSSVLVLMLIATPLAWWLATTRSRAKPLVEAMTALPIVLPATVLGFYLLVLMSPTTPIGAAFLEVTGSTLTFSFAGLLVASVLHSLPFAVQPLQTAFSAVGRGVLETAASLGAHPFDAFRSIAVPLSRRGFLTAAVLSFAHSIGEFGVVLMVGGNIPGRTRTISIEIYNAVETLDYETAHILSAGLLFATVVLLVPIYALGQSRRG